MKALAICVALAVLVCASAGCGGEKKEKDKGDGEGPIESTVDYMTGKTPIEAGARAKRTAIQTSILSAVTTFEAENGRSPISLKELVGAGYLQKRWLNDEYGRPLEVEAGDGKLIVRSVRTDKDTGQRTVEWEKTF